MFISLLEAREGDGGVCYDGGAITERSQKTINIQTDRQT